MTQYRIALLLDDTVPSQATLLGQIQAALQSIASNVPPSEIPRINNIEVRKLA